MKTAHTPGPWCYQFEHGSYIIQAPSQAEPDKMHLVAELVSIEDTKLIAAAPDLLEILMRIVDWNERRLESGVRAERGITEIQLVKAHKAIAKATGEAS